MKSFQGFCLDTANQCLWRGPERVAIPPKPYDMLRYLVENPGRLVTHDELLEKLWPEIYVNPELIRKYILDIRKILGDRPDKPEFIETVTKRGYRFIAPVIDERATPPPELGTQKRDTESGRSASVSSGSAAVEREVGSHVTPQPPLSQSSPVPGVPSSSTGVKVAEVTGTSGRLWKLLIPATAILVAAIGGWFYFRSHRTATALTEKDTIVLADFDNKTGDAVFDDTLKRALAVELEQSPFLNIVSDRRVSATLRMMGRPANEGITMDIGQELCVRTGSKALLGGTISRLGDHYLLNLNAFACNAGDNLAREEGEAKSREDVLKTLSRISSSLRGKLGESLPSVQKFNVPMEATTSSLEALRNFSMGMKVWYQEGDAPSIMFFKQAIQLDPEFPMAYAMLSTVYGNLLQPSVELEYATKAYLLRDRVSEREKLRITDFYFRATGDLDKEVETCELWTADYPRDAVPHGLLGQLYHNTGQYDKALVEYQDFL